jgi:hypothetical protein
MASKAPPKSALSRLVFWLIIAVLAVVAVNFILVLGGQHHVKG